MNVRSQHSGIPFMAFYNSLGNSAKVEQGALKTIVPLATNGLLLKVFKPGDRLTVEGAESVRPGLP